MEGTPSSQAVATPLQGAMDGISTALTHLIKVVDDGALNDLDTHGTISLLQELETIRNMMPVLDRAAIEYGIEQGVAHALCQRSMVQVLVNALRLSPAEAGRRVRAAEHLADRLSVTGEPLAPM